MTNSSFNTNYVSQTLAQAPPDWSKSLWEWYERDRARREKYGEQLAANLKTEVEYKDKYSFKEFMKAGAEFSKSAGSLFEQLEEQEADRKATEKKETTELWDQLRRGKGTFAAEKKFFEEVHNYRLQKKDIFKDKHKFNELIKELPEEVRQQYSRLNASTIVHAREYVGLRVAQGLNGQQHKLYLANKGEGALEAFENAGDSQDDIFKTWQMEQLRPYGFSNGLVSDVLLEGLNRQASTRAGTARTRAVAAKLSNNALQLLENIKGREDNTQNLAQFIISQTSDLKLDRGYKDIEGGKTGIQQAFEEIDNALNELAFKGEIDIPALLDEEVEINGEKTTLGKHYYNDKQPGKGGKANKYTDLMKSWEYGRRAIAQKFAVARDANFQEAFDICASGDKRCDAQFKRLALQTYESKGGDTNKANYKSFSGLKIVAQNKTTFEKDTKAITPILEGGDVELIESGIKTLTNNQAIVAAKEELDGLKQSQEINKFGKGRDHDPEEIVTAEIQKRAKTKVNLGGAFTEPSAITAKNTIKKYYNEIYYSLYKEAVKNGNTGDRTIADRANVLLKQRLKNLGFYAEWGSDESGVLTSNEAGVFVNLLIQNAADNENRIVEGSSSDERNSQLELNRILGVLKQRNQKSIRKAQGQVGTLTIPELVSFAQNGFDWENPISKTGFKFIKFPADLKYKAKQLNTTPVNLALMQLEALENDKSRNSTEALKAFPFLTKLKEQLVDVQKREDDMMEAIKGTDLEYQVKQFGYEGLPPTVISRIKTAIQTRDMSRNDPQFNRKGELTNPGGGMADLPPTYTSNEKALDLAAKWYREGKWDGVTREQLIKLLKEEKAKQQLQTTE